MVNVLRYSICGFHPHVLQFILLRPLSISFARALDRFHSQSCLFRISCYSPFVLIPHLVVVYSPQYWNRSTFWNRRFLNYVNVCVSFVRKILSIVSTVTFKLLEIIEGHQSQAKFEDEQNRSSRSKDMALSRRNFIFAGFIWTFHLKVHTINNFLAMSHWRRKFKSNLFNLRL